MGKRRGDPIYRLYKAEKADDVFEFVKALEEAHGLVRYDADFKRLFEMIGRRITVDRAGMLDELFDFSATVIGWCLLRMGSFVQESATRRDQTDAHHRNTDLPEAVNETLLPRLLETTRLLAEIEQIRVTLERQRELTRARKVETDRLVRQQAGQEMANEPASAMTNGRVPPNEQELPSRLAAALSTTNGHLVSVE